MELQAAPVETDRIGSTVDVPTMILKDVRAEAAARITLTKPAATPAPAEEVLVLDQRAGVSPAQSVERKLFAMLRGDAAIPASHSRLVRLCRNR